MRREITIRFGTLFGIAMTAFLILFSSSAEKKPAGKESMDECCHKKDKVPDDDNLIWETFTRQLISSAN
jgi:hypothetical protein